MTMRLVLAVVGILLFANSACADSPNLLITSHYDKILDSLQITANVEWNKDEYLENNARLEHQDVFFAGEAGRKVVRQYAVMGEDIEAKTLFKSRAWAKTGCHCASD